MEQILPGSLDAPDGVAYEPTTDDMMLVREIHKNLKDARDHLHEWKQAAKESYDFFAGHQWSQEDHQKLNEENRPTIVFNRIPRVVNAVAGLEIQNRQEVTYYPRTNGDVIGSDILTSAANWVRDNCDAEDEESQAFKDCLITGLGFIETRLDYEVDPDGAIIIERLDPLEMLYDPTSQKRNLDDAAWIAHVRHYKKKDFFAMWPDAEDKTLGTFDADPKGMQPHDATLAPFYINDQSDKLDKERDENMVEVIQYQYWKREVFYRVELMDGQIQEFDADEFRQRRQEILLLSPQYTKQYRKKYRQVFLAGQYILEKGDCPVNNFTFRAITGLVDHSKGIWLGLVELMKDPQRWANKWLSQTLHIVNSNAKGGYFAESDAFEDNRQAEKSLATTSITWLNDGGIAKIQKKEPPIFPQQIDALLQYAITSIADVVGVNLEMLGQANREQAARLEYERKKAGITVVADFFDALRRYRKEEGRVLAEFIMEYISDGRLVKVTGEGLGQYVPLFKKDLSLKYDIVVDESPTSPNHREIVFDRIVQLFPMLLQAGIPLPPDLLDYSPFPGQLIASWKKAIEESHQPNEKQMAEEKLRFDLAQSEVAQKQSDAQLKQASAVERQTAAALNVAKAGHEDALASLEGSKDRRENVKVAIDAFKNRTKGKN